MKNTFVLLAGLALIGIGYSLAFLTIKPKASMSSASLAAGSNGSMVPPSYFANIAKETTDNQNFRKVLFTGPKSQLVVMSILPGSEVGSETHKYTEQTLFFLSGTGKGVLNDKEFPIGSGDVVVVTAGTKHNFINTGKVPLKIYTVYSPPNHIDGRVQLTKADADADAADEAIGETAPK